MLTETPTFRLMERMDMPSTSMDWIMTRLARGSVFVPFI